MSYSSTKVAVRDSFDDEDVSDDVEDEVFIRDGRNGFRADEERGVKRPLMAPRRKSKQSQQHTELNKKRSWKRFFLPCFYGVLGLTSLLGLIAIVVCLALWFPFSVKRISFWKSHPVEYSRRQVVPCTEIHVHDVWTKNFPKFTVESPIVQSDMNHDGIMDVIIGYGTELDDETTPDFLCEVYFGIRARPCAGGVLALNGRTGDVLWQHWTSHTVYSVDCVCDLTGDKINDCLITGKGGVFEALNGHDGSIVWKLKGPELVNPLINIYSGKFIRDMNGDGVNDILAVHSLISFDQKIGQLILVSGKEGRVLLKTATPNNEESYYGPQIIANTDGDERVLFGTGGQNSGGGLYVVPLLQMDDSRQIKAIYVDEDKGILSPPVLVDVNEDGFEDIVLATFNSAVLAFDGISFKPLWNYTFPYSETFSSLTPGYFNDDDIPDFLFKFQTGPGFPVYYLSQTTILDGSNGFPIILDPVVDLVASQAGGLTLSVEGLGNDYFLYWTANCNVTTETVNYFMFTPGTSVHSQSKSDLCKLRYNSTMTTIFQAINQHLELPGIPLYESETRMVLEYNNTRNTSADIYQYLMSHPDMQYNYKSNQASNVLHNDKYQAENKNYNSHLKTNKDFINVYKDTETGAGINPAFDPSHVSALRSDKTEEVLPDFSNLRGPLNIRKHGVRFQPSSNENINEKVLNDWKKQFLDVPYDFLSIPKYEASYESGERSKRSSSPAQGIQRITSTGTLIAPLHYDSSSMDLVFATYWVSPDPNAQVFNLKDKDCVQRLQIDKQIPLITALQECLAAEQLFSKSFNHLKSKKLHSQHTSPPQLGQMTVYRLNIQCTCKSVDDFERCATVLPYHKQSWPGFMGPRGDGVFRTRF